MKTRVIDRTIREVELSKKEVLAAVKQYIEPKFIYPDDPSRIKVVDRADGSKLITFSYGEDWPDWEDAKEL